MQNERFLALAPQLAVLGWTPATLPILVAAVIFLLAVVGLVLQIQRSTKKILAALPRGDEGRRDRDRIFNELAVMRSDTRDQIAALRTAIDEMPAKLQQRVQNLQRQQPTQQQAPAPRSYERSEPSRTTDDPSAPLLAIANQIAQQSSTTVDALRASLRDLPVRVSAWPNETDAVPAAFLVEYRDVCYVIPNVMKPGRLQPEWFNRSEFGINDEIGRVVALPRLRRQGSGFDVDAPGVFSR